MNAEFIASMEYWEREKGLDREILISAVEDAMVSAAKRAVGPARELRCEIDRKDGDIRAFASLIVVETVTDKQSEISLESAKRHKPDVQLDEEMEVEVTPKNFGRIASQNAKQALMQAIRRAEKALVYSEFKDRVGDIVSGEVRGFDRSDVLIDLGKFEALLPNRERVPTEEYQRSERIRCLVKAVQGSDSHSEIILSRRDTDFVLKLFLLEVSEINDGTIEVNPVLDSYPPGTSVTLTARPADGLRFDEWEGDASGSAESVTLVMDDHKSVSIRYLADNQPPTVAITSPKHGRFFSAPSDVVITVDATDPDGSIAAVLYERKLIDATEWTALGQAADAAAPFTWEGASEGVYEIRATVTDNRGAKALSAPIQITLTTGNLPPVIVSTSPAAGDYLPVPGNFTFTVVAYDPDGEVKSIRINGGYKFTKVNGPDYWTENDDGVVLTDIRWAGGAFETSRPTGQFLEIRRF